MKANKWFLYGLLVSCAGKLSAQQAQPNIVLINIDDLGWADLSYQGSSYYETPNIDRLRNQGIMFTQAYACGANSAPSRACLLTGQYTPRHGMFTVGEPARGEAKHRKFIPIPNKTSLDNDVQMLPQTLHDAGYQTCHIGKWHVTADPLRCGMDVNIGGNSAGNPKTYFAPYSNPNLTDGEKGEFLPDRLGNEAVDYLKKVNKSKPFFLYYAPYEVHTPLQAEPELIEKYRNKKTSKAHDNPVYAAMVETMDRNVGKVLNEIEALNISHNTLIIFTSDNGGVYDISRQWPLRAGKGSFYEGGIRVPLIFFQKGKFEKREINEIAVSQIDMYPTLMAVAGIENKNLLLDGKNLLPLLAEKNDSGWNERPLFWHFPAYLEGGNAETTDHIFRTRPVSVIRKGKWKLIENYETKKIELYDIQQDISEQTDLSAINPQKTDELYRLLVEWKKQVNAPEPRELNPLYEHE